MSTGCVFTYTTNNCNNIYFFTNLAGLYYKVTKKILKKVRTKPPLNRRGTLSRRQVKPRYIRTKINGKNSIRILKSDYQTFIQNLTTTDNFGYNRNIPLEHNIF